MADLRQAICETARELQPVTVRGLFYQIANNGSELISKDERGYRHVVREAGNLRERGELPFGWIADRTRWMIRPAMHRGLGDFLEESKRLYRRDLWAQQAAHVEIWIEKEALAGTIADVTDDWGVGLAAIHGYTSKTFAHESALQLREIDKPKFIYYLGDCDAHGLQIERDLRDKLKRYSRATGLHFKRLALTPQQIRTWRIPTRPPKPADRRAGMALVADLDALPAPRLRSLVGQAILRHVDRGQLVATDRIEREERATLARVLESLAPEARP